MFALTSWSTGPPNKVVTQNAYTFRAAQLSCLRLQGPQCTPRKLDFLWSRRHAAVVKKVVWRAAEDKRSTAGHWNARSGEVVSTIEQNLDPNRQGNENTRATIWVSALKHQCSCRPLYPQPPDVLPFGFDIECPPEDTN